MPKRRLTKKEKLRMFRRTIVWPYAGVALLILPLALLTTWDSRVIVDVKVRELAFDFVNSPRGVVIDPGTYEYAHFAQQSTIVLRDLGTGAVTHIAVAPEGSLTIDKPRLDELKITPGSRVTLQRADEFTFAARIRGGPASVQLTVPSAALIECEICSVGDDEKPRERFSGAVPADSLAVVRATERMHVVLGTTAAPVIAEHIQIADPAFISGSASSLSGSLVEDGKVTLRDVPGVEIPILRSDVFSFERPHDFEISSITAAPEALHVTMTGCSRQLRSGRVGALEDRFPTLLSRIHANQKAALYFSAVVFVAGTLLAVLRQLRFIEGDK